MKNILIIGANGGIGELLTKSLANENNHFILVARNKNKLNDLIHEIKQINPIIQITSYICDLSVNQQVLELIKNLEKHDVDLYINNAGIGHFAYVGDIDINKTFDLFKVNNIVPIQITNALVKKMYANKKGHIIYIASLLSKFSFANTSVYSSSKHALRAFANSLRLEAKEHNVHVSVINPNAIQTDFFKNANDSGNFIKKYTNKFLDPQDVVKKIIKVIKKPQYEVDIPKKFGFANIIATMFFKFYNWLIFKKQTKKNSS